MTASNSLPSNNPLSDYLYEIFWDEVRETCTLSELNLKWTRCTQVKINKTNKEGKVAGKEKLMKKIYEGED
jgi:hypothetical protein